jgi:hypothetical protein
MVFIDETWIKTRMAPAARMETHGRSGAGFRAARPLTPAPYENLHKVLNQERWRVGMFTTAGSDVGSWFADTDQKLAIRRKCDCKAGL